MTQEDLHAALKDICPNSELLKDNDGQLVLYTGLLEDNDGQVQSWPKE